MTNTTQQGTIPYLWIIEAKLTYPLSPYNKGWQPLPGKSSQAPHLYYSHRTRSAARETARVLFRTNAYNNITPGHIAVRYRAAKYVRHEPDTGRH